MPARRAATWRPLQTANIAIVEVADMESMEGIFPLPANELASVAVTTLAVIWRSLAVLSRWLA